MKFTEGGVTAAKGFEAAGAEAQIKYKNRMLAKLINEKLADKEKRDQQSEEYEQFAISSEIELEDRLLEKEQEEQCESSDEDDTEVASGEKDENRQIFKELNRIVVQDRLYLSPELSREDLAQIVHLNNARFARMIKECTGTNFNGYINELRIDYAIQLLKTHPHYTIRAIADEAGFNSAPILYSLFKSMHTVEYYSYFRNQTDNRITELQEEIAGIDKRLSALHNDKSTLSDESKENANRFLITTNPTLLNLIQEKQNELDEKIKQIDNEINKYKRAQSKKTSDIERIKDSNGKEKLQNLSIEEQGELYHKYLERVNYIPVTTMQGYYVVKFINGIIFDIAITKVRSIAMASPIPDKWSIDEKGIITMHLDKFTSSNLKKFSLATETIERKSTLQEYLKSDLAKERALKLDLSYRERYLKELHNIGLDGRLRPLSEKE